MTIRTRTANGGHALFRESDPVLTRSGEPVVVPSRALAVALAREYGRVRHPQPLGAVQPALVRLVSKALGYVTQERDRVVGSIAAYGNAELLVHRAETSAELAARQARAWDPLLAWSRECLRAELKPVKGVLPHDQSSDALGALARAVNALDRFELAGVGDLVSISGSLVLGLAVLHGRIEGEEAWELSTVDERWQAEHWGWDAEAAALAERKKAEFLFAAEFLGLHRRNDG